MIDAPIIDVREEALIKYLEHIGKPHQVKQLLIGDAQVSGEMVIEIKRVKRRPPYGKFEEYNDVWASLIDNRLYRQAKNRKDNFAKTSLEIVEVEEGAEFFTPSFTNDHWISIQITLAQSFNTAVMLSSGMAETVEIIYETWEKEKAGEHYVSPYIKRPTATTLYDYQRNLLMGLLNVGEEKAIVLLEKFKTPLAVVNWIINTPVQRTKSGKPKQMKKTDPNYLYGFGPTFFIESKALLCEVYQ
jgi:ERCC4-type nuclease